MLPPKAEIRKPVDAGFLFRKADEGVGAVEPTD
jgi:hypothetical protein